MIDLLGYVAYTFIFFGSYLIAKKKSVGWLYRILGNVMWVGLGLALGLTSIVVAEVIFIALDSYGFKQWRKDEQHQKRLN